MIPQIGSIPMEINLLPISINIHTSETIRRYFSFSDLCFHYICAESTIYGVFDLRCRLLSPPSFLIFYYSQLWGHSQSSLQKYISLPLHTSVFGISKRHAHKVFIKCPVSKLRLRLQTVETGHYFCSLMPLRNARKPR